MRGLTYLRAVFLAALLCPWYFPAIVFTSGPQQTSIGGKMNQFTRRGFLTTVGGAAGVAFLGSTLFNPDTVLAATPLVRRDVGGMNGYDPILVSYGKAIQAMQALPN